LHRIGDALHAQIEFAAIERGERETADIGAAELDVRLRASTSSVAGWIAPRIRGDSSRAMTSGERGDDKKG
jgi:hypothetical protein